VTGRRETVDLFGGPGGWDVAATGLGLPVTGIEKDRAACETRRAAGLATVEGDVRHYGPGDFPGATDLMGSPPCQPFSVAGKGRGRAALNTVLALADRLAGRRRIDRDLTGLDDERTGLVLEPLRCRIDPHQERRNGCRRPRGDGPELAGAQGSERRRVASGAGRCCRVRRCAAVHPRELRAHEGGFLMTTHPLPPGTPVRHVSQEWARTATAEVIDVNGPDARGGYEYGVLAGQDFSRPLGFDNVMDRFEQWSSRAVIAAPTEEPTP
jgi:hypothetical protein